MFPQEAKTEAYSELCQTFTMERFACKNTPFWMFDRVLNTPLTSTSKSLQNLQNL